MDGIDPRLRDVAPPQYEQHQRPPAGYNGITGQAPGYDAAPPSSSNASAGPGQTQQHRYYSMPTPRSYSSGPHQDTDGSPYDARGPPDLSDPNDLKRPRACEACRQLKVRCEPDDDNPTGTCRRCQKANRQCIVTAPSRKRQKKTDSRVAELEKKINALTATIHAHRAPGSVDSPVDPAIAQPQTTEPERQRGQLYHQPSWPERHAEGNMTMDTHNFSSPTPAHPITGAKRKLTRETQIEVYNSLDDNGEQQATRAPAPSPSKLICLFNGDPSGSKEVPENSYLDVIDRQIIDAHTAYRIFDRYNTDMQCVPIVVFPPGTKAEDIRRSKPLLFLAILSVASNTIRPELQAAFTNEIMRMIADRVICRGEKTLELVQTLQLVTVYYRPPDRYDELNFNQLIHIAVVMAIDLGMGKRSRAGNGPQWREQVGKISHTEVDAAETRRAWLGLYFMCANAAMALRRPLLVRWSPYMDESLEVLAKAPDALPSDKWLAHAVRAQRIAEDVGYQFSMDDPPSDVSITEPKTQYQIKTFEKQLDEWRQGLTEDMPQALVKHNDAIINLYIHEIAMHHSHNIDDFRPPYGVGDDNEDEPDYITPAHIDSLIICLDSVHKAFDAFLGLPVSTIRSLPTLFFVRNSYAAVALIKIYTAVSAKGSKFGSVFKPEDLKVEHYLDSLGKTMKDAAEGGKCRVAMKFNFILGMLRSWQTKRASGSSTQKDKEMMCTKAMDVDWPKQEQAGKVASWNTKAVGSNAANSQTSVANPKSHRSGLQMLSEVAMGNNNNRSTSKDASDANRDAAAAALATTPSTTATNPATSSTPWDLQLATYPHMHPHQQAQQAQQASNGLEDGGFAPQQQGQGQGQGGDGYMPMQDIENFAYTAEELGALGNLMDDPNWLSFGLENGSWVM